MNPKFLSDAKPPADGATGHLLNRLAEAHVFELAIIGARKDRAFARNSVELAAVERRAAAVAAVAADFGVPVQTPFSIFMNMNNDMKQQLQELPRTPVPCYLDKAALARTFGVSKRTVCRWIDEGVPALEVGCASGTSRRILRFSVPAVHAWLENRAVRKSLNLQ